MAESREKHRVVIVGAGFAGFNAARELSRLVGATTEIVVINSTDYFLYLPLMPQVSGGLVEPAHVCVSLPRRLRKTRFVLGTVNHVDSREKVVSWAGPEGTAGQVGYDRLILTAGSVNKLLPIPGVADYAHGFRTIAEASYLRDHIIRQLELAAVAADPARARGALHLRGGRRGLHRHRGRRARSAADHPAGQDDARPGRAADPVDAAGHSRRGCWPELDPRLSKTAERVLRRRGVEVLTGQSVAEALRRLRAADHRGEGAHPIADLVRRGPRRPAGGRPGPAHQPGAAGGR